MRVLFSSTSGLGHIHPMLPLAAALRARGHDVRWAVARDAVDRLRRLGYPADPAGITWPDRVAEFRRRFPEAVALTGDERSAHMFPRLFGAIGARAMFDALRAVAAAHPPDLIVSERAEVTGPAVARMLGLPQVTHGFGLVVPPERLQAAVEFAADIWADVGVDPPPFGGSYEHLYVDIYPPSMQPEDLSYIPRIQRLRPEAFDDGDRGDEPSWLREVLADPRPLAYVTAGTLFNDAALLRILAHVLADRPDLAVIVTVGPGADPAVLGPQPDHIFVAPYVPQERILGSAAVVVSHAGSGTLLGALRHGVPQVCIPQGADQLRNARAAQRAGAAIAVFAEDLAADAVGDALSRALEEPAIRAAAARIAGEIAEMPSPATVAERLEDLVASRHEALA